MMDFLQRYPLIGMLAAAIIALAAVIAVETGFGTRLAPSLPSGPSRPAAALQAKLMPPLIPANAEQTYPEMTARPLFVPLRRPAPAAEPAVASTLKRDQFILQGVIIAGDTRIALLKEKATGKIHRVEKGHELNGMKLAEVNPESVVLAQGGEQEVLPLTVQKAALAATSASGPFGNGNPQATAAAYPAGVSPPPTPGASAPGVPRLPQGGFGPRAPNSAPATMPQATSAPLTPEELLARRRARRAQQRE